MEDTFKHRGWRYQMVEALAAKGINDSRVLNAMKTVPRHLFLETMLDYVAYQDSALPIQCGQTISQPSTVAFQSQLLDSAPDLKVLEVGTGSGYQTAILCALGMSVYSIERQKDLFDRAKKRLASMGYRANCFLGDGYKGLPEYGPFDRIIITCGASHIPEALIDQMKVGAVMVIPVGDGQQEMLRVVKLGEGHDDIVSQRYGNFTFVPMLQKLDYGK